jgi:hypothetical protein
LKRGFSSGGGPVLLTVSDFGATALLPPGNQR